MLTPHSAVVRMFVGKNSTSVQTFLSVRTDLPRPPVLLPPQYVLTVASLQWISGQPEQELVNKLTFARSKVGADNQAFTSLVPVVCPERTPSQCCAFLQRTHWVRSDGSRWVGEE